MKWLDNIIDKRIKSQTPEEKRQWGRGEARIVKKELYRISKDIKKCRLAQQEAEDWDYPQRTELIQIYKDLLDDSQVWSTIQTRIAKATSGHIAFYKDEEYDEEISKLFIDNKGYALPWFRSFMIGCEWAKFYGNELIQLGNIKDNIFTYTKRIPNENLIPQWEGFIFDWEVGYSKDGINFMRYDEKSVVNWLIPVGDPKDLGLLNKVMFYVVWKEVFGSWSMHADLFGQPLRIGKTNITDPERKQNMMSMLAALTQGAYAAIDMDDIIELVQEQKGDPYSIYKELIKVCDEAISKIILGSTMVTDSGSSRSQAEVHENTTDDVILMDKIDLQTVVNEKLIPRMQKLGMIPEGKYTCVWDFDERLNIKDWAGVIQQLSMAGYKLSKEEVENRIGVELEDMPEQQEETPEEKTQNVLNLYKDYLNE